jgi:hypothetical protein
MRSVNIFIFVTFVVGISMTSYGLVSAQNITDNNSTVPVTRQVVQQVAENSIVAWTGILTIILGFATLAVKVFHLDEKTYGKGITMATDVLHGIYDDRKTWGQLAGVSYDISPEEAQKFVRERVIPVAVEMNKKANELQPKLEEYREIAGKFGYPLESVNYGKKFGK